MSGWGDVRLIHFDIDTLRADHLGCYGYHRQTSPNIDALAREGIRFDNVFASDTPCLPSRTALSSGRFGIHTGVAGHGGTAADPLAEGSLRGFRRTDSAETWASLMRDAGMWTASISTFAERHSAYQFLAGFNESFNLGTRGLETAEQVAPVVLEWLEDNARRAAWYLHVHLWDPHTPYRTPDSYGDPFADDPCPAWLTEDVRAEHWLLPGPHSAQEISGFGPRPIWDGYPRQPQVASDMTEVRRMFDGYDVGVRYADDHVGIILDRLGSIAGLDDVAVIASSDHGETLGELGIYCDHQTADLHVARVPMIIRWPGLETGVDARFLYQFDVTATLLDLMGIVRPESWDGRSFAPIPGTSRAAGRPQLVLTQGAWTAQRSVRFDEWLCIHTRHDGFHGYPEYMLFDVEHDPHEQRDLAAEHPDIVLRAGELLSAWRKEALNTSLSGVDPLDTVLEEGGPWHAQLCPSDYPARLRATGRAVWADKLQSAGILR